jgi:hypothetical protein
MTTENCKRLTSNEKLRESYVSFGACKKKQSCLLLREMMSAIWREWWKLQKTLAKRVLWPRSKTEAFRVEARTPRRRAFWCSGNLPLDLHSRIFQFGFRTGGWPCCYQSLRWTPLNIEIGRERFVTNPFLLTIHNHICISFYFQDCNWVGRVLVINHCWTIIAVLNHRVNVNDVIKSRLSLLKVLRQNLKIRENNRGNGTRSRSEPGTYRIRSTSRTE